MNIQGRQEDTRGGNLQPINSHEAWSGKPRTHLGGFVCRARGKHKKRGQNEALRVTKCCTLQESELLCNALMFTKLRPMNFVAKEELIVPNSLK